MSSEDQIRIDEDEGEWKLGDWTAKINEAYKEIKALKELNKRLKTRVVELLEDLIEAERRIEQVEDSNRAHLQHIEQLELEVKEGADEITEQVDSMPSASSSHDHQHHHSHVNKALPTTACPRQPPRKSIINFLI